MSFVSFEFIIFALVVLPLYFAIRSSFRWLFLLVTSYIFYVYGNGWFVLVLAFSTITDFYLAKRIQGSNEQRRRRLYLLVSLSLNLGVSVNPETG